MKLKLIAAAVALVASAPSFAFLHGPDDGGAEMFLSVWQQAGTGTGTTSRSFTLDLGVTLIDMVAHQNTNLFINTVTSGSAEWTSFLAAGTGTLQYSVVAADQTDAADPILLSTFAASTIASKTRQDMFDAQAQIAQYVGANNATGTHTTLANGASFNTSGFEYYMTAASNTWNGTTGNNSAAIGTSMIFGQMQGTSAQNAVSQIYGGLDANGKFVASSMKLFQQGNVYVLQYSVQAVPEPTGIALALAGFGIVGFVARRRKSA